MRNLKLIWDFRGPSALHIAKHHEEHLKDYISAEKLNITITGIELISDMHVIAFMVVPESETPAIRAVLKPNRGQVYKGS
jgi:hypothetical protein